MNKKFKVGIYLSIAVVVAIAIFDILAARSMLFGTVEEYTLGNYLNGWWDLFYQYNLILLLIIPVAYYFLARKDLSESIALFINSYLLWFFGLADLLYFLLQGKMIPAVYPWLNDHIVMGTIAGLFGSEQVTGMVVLISVAIGFISIYSIDKFMEKIN